MSRFVILTAALLMFSGSAYCQSAADSLAVLKTIESWNSGWSEGNATLAVADYAENADWTNAFGDRVVSRDSLRSTLEFIFGLDFVMAGDSGDNEYEDVTFLSPDIALIRSKLVRTGQRTGAGTVMPDRNIHHLRVVQKLNGRWQIISHLISQAQPKR